MKTITVKGVGQVSAKPDLIVIKMRLEACSLQYAETAKLAAEKTDCLSNALAAIGFKTDELKTTDFDVSTKYESKREKNGDYKSVFAGYVCRHALKLEFDFNSDRLGEVLTAISACEVSPELSIEFTVKNPASVSEKLLKSAAENAKAKAEILCLAAGVKLGEIITINYTWGEIDVISHTDYRIEPRLMKAESCIGSVGVTPDDIDVTDSAEFTWAIEN